MTSSLVGASAGKRILLVDDEPELLAVCNEALTERGYYVLRASNGQQALSVLESETVDLVVTDLNMPGMDGMALFEAIKRQRLPVEIIFLTGHGTIDNAVNCLKQGAADYLLKPFDLRTLLSKVDDVMSRRQPPQLDNAPKSSFSIFELTEALARQKDMRSLLREMLNQLRDAFNPDGVVLLLSSQQAPHDTGPLKPVLYWGRIFSHYPELKPVLEQLGSSALTGNTCRLVGPNGHGAGASSHSAPSGQAMLAAPIAFGPFRTGAVCLTRDGALAPFSNSETQLLATLATHAASTIESLRASRRLSTLSMSVVTSYVKAVEAKDVYTRGHSEQVSRYGVALGRKLGLPQADLERLRIAGMLHDVGKIGIPDSILNKPSSLSREEFEIMKRHPVVGQSILSRIEPLKEVLPAIYHHHEWYNGNGYPDGLAGEDIPYLARIISVVDGFEAMTSDRAYHPARPVSRARKVLEECAGTQWDNQIVTAWLELLDENESVFTTPAGDMTSHSAAS